MGRIEIAAGVVEELTRKAVQIERAAGDIDNVAIGAFDQSPATTSATDAYFRRWHNIREETIENASALVSALEEIARRFDEADADMASVIEISSIAR